MKTQGVPECRCIMAEGRVDVYVIWELHSGNSCLKEPKFGILDKNGKRQKFHNLTKNL